MNRLNRILSITLAVQVVIVAIVFLPRLFPLNAGSEPLFGAIKTEDITSLALQDNEGKKIELAKHGDAWVVPASDDFPADNGKVTGFLDKLMALRTNPLIARTDASYKRLQVGDDSFLRRVDFTLADGSAHTLFLGTTSGGSNVRVGGQGEVYLASGLSSYDADTTFTTWITPTYLSIPQDQISALTIQNANGTIAFAKDVSGTWAMQGLASGEVFAVNNLTTDLTRLASLSLSRPLGKQAKPEYGMDPPLATVSITAKDDAGSEKTYTLLIGAKDESDNTYVIKSSESEYYVRAPFYTVDDFANRSRAAFLSPTPTPTSTPEATATPSPMPTPQPTP